MLFDRNGRGPVLVLPPLLRTREVARQAVSIWRRNMERKRTTSSPKSLEEQPIAVATSGQTEVVSIAQIQSLVRLLDRSDVSELEIKRPAEGIHLVLRKAKAADGTHVASLTGASAHIIAASNGVAPASETSISVHRHTVVAPLVGVFHPWLKPRGGILAAVGDWVKVGQLVGTIESLNVFNEVETSVAGRVVEIHVADGQPVEYGQALLTIEIAEVEDI
jgi:acetyl-CoA carboxylase biotin carboxyl carrier protein